MPAGDDILSALGPKPAGAGGDILSALGGPQQQTGPQPSLLQTIAASPLGRLAHDAILNPIESAANFLHPVDWSGIEKPYQNALAAQQNRPGYAQARAQANAVSQGSGFGDQMLAPLAPAMAGLAGLATGGLTGMSAASDAQAAAQAAYRQKHPVLSTAGQLLGGFMAAPSGALSKAVATPALTPEEQATKYVQSLMASSKTAPDVAGLQSVASNAAGKPITSAEAIGKPGEVAVGALARREGGTADALAGEMAARQAGAPDRILGDFAQASGIDPALARGDIDSYVQAGRQTVKPMFDQALANDKGVWNADLARLSNRPVIQDAMQNVVGDLKNADIDPTGLGFTAQDPATGQFIQQPRPTAQAWDMVKKRLGQAVDRDPFGKIIPDSISPGNFNVNNANRALTSTLRDAVPGYGDALDASGDYLSMQKSFTDGQNFILNPKVTAAQVQQHIAGLSSSEAQAFNGGIANKLFDMQQNGRLGAKLADAPSVQQKLTAALGSDNASQFMQRLGMEKSMANFARARVPGAGSPTAEYQAAMANQDAGTGISPDAFNLLANTARRGPVSAGISLAADKAKDVASAWATRGMPVPVRDAAGRMLMMNPADLAAALAPRAAPLAAAPTALSMPAITSASRIPYGMIPFGIPLLAQGANQ